MLRIHDFGPALAGVASCILLAGCPSRDVSKVDPKQAVEQDKEIPINLSRDLDLLFVVDNSISMTEEQASLAANFPAFVGVLEGIPGGLPSLHMGVVSSDMGIGGETSTNCIGDGDAGAWRFGEGDACTPTTDGKGFLTTDPTNVPGGNAGLADQFSCMAKLGKNGCGLEQHLESMKARLSLDDGFLRPEAYLGVIIIADEDDCSAQPDQEAAVFDTSQNSEGAELGFFSSFRCWEYGVVCNDDNPAPRDMPADGSLSGRTNCVPRDDSPYIQTVDSYVEFLKGLKQDPRRVLVAGITGDPEPVGVRRKNIDMDADVEHELAPSCVTSGIGEAAPSTRLSYFLSQFPNRNVFQTICPADGSLAGALDQIAQLLRTVTGTPCLEGELTDTDPDTAGVQPDCRVSDISNYGTDFAEDVSIPSCDVSGGAAPCFTIAESPDCSEFPTGLSISVDYGSAAEAPETTRVVRCAAE